MATKEKSPARRKTVEGRPRKLAVIGDGNAAFDLARTLVRQGDQVTLVSWFPEDLIPSSPHEVRGAREEGVTIVDATRVISFEGENGRLQRLRCRPTRPGEPDVDGIAWPVTIPDSDPFDMGFDQAVVAIGRDGPFCWHGSIGENRSGIRNSNQPGRDALPWMTRGGPEWKASMRRAMG